MQLETIGDIWTHGVRVTMRCSQGRPPGLKHQPHCLYKADLDIETLVCTRGRDFPFAMLASRLRCPRCGSRRISVLMEVPTQPNIAAALVAVKMAGR